MRTCDIYSNLINDAYSKNTRKHYYRKAFPKLAGVATEWILASRVHGSLVGLKMGHLLEASAALVAVKIADVIMNLCDMSCKPISKWECFITLFAAMFALLQMHGLDVFLQISSPFEFLATLFARE